MLVAFLPWPAYKLLLCHAALASPLCSKMTFGFTWLLPCLLLVAAVMPTSKLQEHTGSDKAWVWSAVDYADGEHKVELFCIRFGTPESEWPSSSSSRLSLCQPTMNLHVIVALVTCTVDMQLHQMWLPCLGALVASAGSTRHHTKRPVTPVALIRVPRITSL